MKITRFVSLKILLPCSYGLQKRRKLNEKKAVFVEVSASALTDSFSLLYERFSKEYECSVYYLHNGSAGGRAYLKNCLGLMREIADAKYIFLNEASNVLNGLRLRQETRLIQTWHGCGAFKKFGFSTVDSGYGISEKEMLRYPYYRNQSLVSVSGEACVAAYKDAMRQDERVIRPLGVSRTDVYFDQTFLEQAKSAFYEAWEEAASKKVILFAPTFRGTQTKAQSVELDWVQLKDRLGSRYVIAVKHHPFVRERQPIPEECKDFARDMTERLSIETLLVASNVCVTDYSSLIFEYALLERPMVFYAPDLAAYYDDRGFYYPYEELVPGEICRSEEALAEALCALPEAFDRERVRAFRKRFMSACDGHATERIYEAVTNLP